MNQYSVIGAVGRSGSESMALPLWVSPVDYYKSNGTYILQVIIVSPFF